MQTATLFAGDRKPGQVYPMEQEKAMLIPSINAEKQTINRRNLALNRGHTCKKMLNGVRDERLKSCEAQN